MAGTISLILVVLIVTVAIVWTPVAEFLAMRRAATEDAKKPHRARLRSWFRLAGLVLVVMAVLGQATTASLPDTGLPLSSVDMATAGIGVALLGISYITLRDPEE